MPAGGLVACLEVRMLPWRVPFCAAGVAAEAPLDVPLSPARRGGVAPPNARPVVLSLMT